MRIEKDETERRDWLALLDRALSVAAEGITIADARLPDRPLIYVNDGFERLTGYAAEEVLGRNCRFLQGDNTDPDTVDELRRALTEGRECSVEILNHSKDGTPFWNRLSITPVRDDHGVVSHYIGVQSDVTERREAEAALRRTNEQMRKDLEEAAEVQKAWLPKVMPQVPGYEFGWQFRPCTELAGDSLGVLRLDENRVGLYILDVMGHGVPAALLSATLNRMLSSLREQSCLYEPDPDSATGLTPSSPATVAKALNRQFGLGPETGKFFTFLYGVLDIREGVFSYCTAGHPPPVRINARGARVCPMTHGLPIGVLPDGEYRERSVRVRPGDRLLIYTDGAFEAIDENDREMGEHLMLEGLRELLGEPLDSALAEMVRRVENWCPGERPEDDVTLLAFDVLPAGDGAAD